MLTRYIFLFGQDPVMVSSHKREAAPKTIHMVSLGCARNQVDSETMSGQLLAHGWQLTDRAEQARVIVVNTCSFIEAAADESIEAILTLARHKREGRCRRLIVAGCLPERYGEKIAEALPEVDTFLGTGAFDHIIEAVDTSAEALPACLLPDPDTITSGLAQQARYRQTAHLAYLKIAEGCDRHCTYCIIPRLRGRQKSRPPEVIVAEARGLIASGARELVLVAQESTAYGSDLAGPQTLADLLMLLSDQVDDVWLRVLYGHPSSLLEPMMRVMAERPNICPYFDLPIQHASDRVLRAMGRGTTRQSLERLFDQIRRVVPEAVLRTTVLTGFPGESESDFNALRRFVETIGFDHLGVFCYSDADDLASHQLDEHVPAAVAAQRREALMACQQPISAAKNRSRVGEVCDVLVETDAHQPMAAGRTMGQAPEVDGVTLIRGDADQRPKPLAGDVVRVRIVDAMTYDLVGERV
jgi:ribosomal protein S12 methylthiotransferase